MQIKAIRCDGDATRALKPRCQADAIDRAAGTARKCGDHQRLGVQPLQLFCAGVADDVERATIRRCCGALGVSKLRARSGAIFASLLCGWCAGNGRDDAGAKTSKICRTFITMRVDCTGPVVGDFGTATLCARLC